MDHSTILANIKSKLIAGNYLSVVQEIENITRAGSSGGEILPAIGFYLKHLDKENMGAYNLVKPEIEGFINCLRDIGIKLL